VRTDNKSFLPETLLQWLQALSLVIGVALVVHSAINQLNNSIADLDRRVFLIEHTLNIKR
jgi:hypothetical protein